MFLINWEENIEFLSEIEADSDIKLSFKLDMLSELKYVSFSLTFVVEPIPLSSDLSSFLNELDKILSFIVLIVGWLILLELVIESEINVLYFVSILESSIPEVEYDWLPFKSLFSFDNISENVLSLVSENSLLSEFNIVLDSFGSLFIYEFVSGTLSKPELFSSSLFIILELEDDFSSFIIESEINVELYVLIFVLILESVSSIPKELLFNFSLVLDDISENVLSLFNILLLLIYVLSKGSLEIESDFLL